MIELGYLRETEDIARRESIRFDRHLSGLDTYLSYIFPEVKDWVHNKQTGLYAGNKKSKLRPDYRSEELRLIVEFDGFQHFTDPRKVISDVFSSEFYRNSGYKVVRIPYFVQLTKKAIKELFAVEDVDVHSKKRSLFVSYLNTPAFVCSSGLERMRKDLVSIDKAQGFLNIAGLLQEDNRELSGYALVKDLCALDD